MKRRKKLNQNQQSKSEKPNQATLIPSKPIERKGSDDTHNEPAAKDETKNSKEPLWEKRFQNWAIVGFTGILTLYTVWLYDFSVQQAKDADNVIKEQQRFSKIEMRAYVFVKDIRLSNIKKREVTVQFVNVGKTPAYQLLHDESIKLGGTNIYEHEIGKLGKFNTIGNQAIGASLEFSTIIELESKINEADFIKIINGQKDWRIYGMISYTDAFSDSHSTKYCFKFFPSKGAFETCDKGNDAN